MALVCITGSTDGIGLAAARQLLGDGHEVLVHARSAGRGEPVLSELSGLGKARLVVADLADLDQVRALAEVVGDVDVLVHNAGIWPDPGAPRSAQGYEVTFAVNALAPHLLTALLRDRVRDRLVFLGSGMAGSGQADPGRLGTATEPWQAYADSKAVDVALALGWARRLPDLRVGAVDPGWVKTKLAAAGAPGDVRSGGARVATAAADPGWPGGYTAGTRPARLPGALTSTRLQDELLAAMDRLAGV
jgi:NAD(P)-dependent dehydrogenase (short-subunit alcohol dehydrogenase family)